jgi:hypothetical protein
MPLLYGFATGGSERGRHSLNGKDDQALAFPQRLKPNSMVCTGGGLKFRPFKT